MLFACLLVSTIPLSEEELKATHKLYTIQDFFNNLRAKEKNKVGK